MRAKLAIVIPCYNEEKVMPIIYKLFLEQLNRLKEKSLIAEDSKILFVNDGSSDRTWEIICDLAKEYKCIRGISLSCNRGHQNALLAGLMEVKDEFDITISIDCDGQDDISVMEEMVEEYINGAEIVYGVRDNRDTDTFFKRETAQGLYKLLKLLGAEVVYNHADYRLVSCRVLKEFADFHEVNLFIRGLIPLVGFSSTTVYYKRKERIAGNSNYSLSKMVSFAIDGITSLSIRPLRLITVMGILVSLASFMASIWACIRFYMGETVAGWTSTICVISFLSGIQLFSTGIVGEYIGKIYLEVKARPRYIISERTYHKS